MRKLLWLLAAAALLALAGDAGAQRIGYSNPGSGAAPSLGNCLMSSGTTNYLMSSGTTNCLRSS